MGRAPTAAETDHLAVLFNAGRDAEVERQAGLLIKRFPDSGFTWKALGLSLLMQGKEALPALRKATELLPDDAALHSKLGDALQARGQLADAVTSYRRAVAIKPDLAEAHNNLGVALRALRELGGAVESCCSALAIDPGYAVAHNTLGGVLQDLGLMDEALASYSRAVALKPEFAEAHNNLGLALQHLGRLDDAQACYHRALAINPNFAEAHNNLGVVLRATGQLADAVTSYRRALAIKPDFAKAHNNLGIALRDIGQFDAAVKSYQLALDYRPDYDEAYHNLGGALQDLDRLDDAEACYRRALELHPHHAQLHNSLGLLLQTRGRPRDAEASYRRALAIKPDFDESHNNLGAALQTLGRLEEAVVSYRQALAIRPEYAEAHLNLSGVLLHIGPLDEAVASCRAALASRPDYAEAYSNLGGAMQAMGQLDGAMENYRKALALKPNYAPCHSNLLFCLSHGQAVDVQALFAEHCRFGEQFEAPLRSLWPKHTNSRIAMRCLQVGFVSGDLRDHAVAHFIEPVLAHLSSSPRLSLHAYSNSAIEDGVTQRLKCQFKYWHPVLGLSDDALAQKIQDDGIDILIDLSGHTALNRLLVFASKPAPVQASWTGYPGTTGLRAMDYYLADRFFLPEGKFDDQFTEKIVRLPAAVTFQPRGNAPPVNALPALSSGRVTFGSFNRVSKISRPAVALWAELLRAKPDSRMVLGAMPKDSENTALREWFEQEGIESTRLIFHERSGMDAYLALHHQVDICLDTFPYSGGTTTFHALWMGVPTLSLTGSTAAGRGGPAIVGGVGLDVFVAHDKEEFVKKGLWWANNLAALAEIRTGLRERFAQSAAGQPGVIAAGLERALRLMWQGWCQDLPPQSFEVHQRDLVD